MTNNSRPYAEKDNGISAGTRENSSPWTRRPFRSERENAIVALFIFEGEEIRKQGGLAIGQIGYVLDTHKSPRGGKSEWLDSIKDFLNLEGFVTARLKEDNMALRYPSQKITRHCRKLASMGILAVSNLTSMGPMKYIPGPNIHWSPRAWRSVRKDLMSFEERDTRSNGFVSVLGISRLQSSQKENLLPRDLQSRMLRDIEDSARAWRNAWLGEKCAAADKIRSEAAKEVEKCLVDAITPWRGRTAKEIWIMIQDESEKIDEVVRRVKGTAMKSDWDETAAYVADLRKKIRHDREHEQKKSMIHALEGIVYFKLRYLDLEARTKEAMDQIAADFEKKMPAFPFIVVDLGKMEHPLA